MGQADKSATMASPTMACPICGRPATATHRPFCSQRCADVDLSRWLGEAYRVPAAEEDDAAPGGDGDGA